MNSCTIQLSEVPKKIHGDYNSPPTAPKSNPSHASHPVGISHHNPFLSLISMMIITLWSNTEYVYMCIFPIRPNWY